MRVQENQNQGQEKVSAMKKEQHEYVKPKFVSAETNKQEIAFLRYEYALMK